MAKDQPKNEESKTLDDHFDEGAAEWTKDVKAAEEMEFAKKKDDKSVGVKVKEEKTEEKKEAKEEVVEKKTEEKKEVEKKEEETREPIMTLERGDEKIPIYTQDELKEYAQKGLDYTKKTQSLANEKKEVETTADKFTDVAEKFMSAMDKLEGKTEPVEIPETREQMVVRTYKEFSIDPEYAEPNEKALVEEIVDTRVKTSAQEKRIGKIEEFQKLMVAKEVGQDVKDAVTRAGEEFPLDDIRDEEGNSLTSKQFQSMLIAKANSKEGEKRSFKDLAVETVKELHHLQKGSKKDIPTGEDFSKLSPEEFKAKYPEYYEKLTTEAVEDHEKEMEDLPPSLDHKRSEIELKKGKPKKPNEMSRDPIGDALDAAFEDPEIRDGLSR